MSTAPMISTPSARRATRHVKGGARALRFLKVAAHRAERRMNRQQLAQGRDGFIVRRVNAYDVS